METTKTQVLIIGGGLVGLSAALFLAKRGLGCILVERHPGFSPLPRAMGFTTRSMELYRAAGIGGDIPQVPPGAGRPRRIRVESLTGARVKEEIAWTPPAADARPQPDAAPLSPCTAAALAQDGLERILFRRAIEAGADIRMGEQMQSFAEDADGVTATIAPGDGAPYRIRADYMIAADGNASPIRETLGIGRQGRGHLRTMRSIMFRAPLDAYRGDGPTQFEILQPDFEAMLSQYRGAGEFSNCWLLIVADDRDHDTAGLTALVHRAVGRQDFAPDIVATGMWRLGALIADRFAAGRIFLAGDAAHALPPARGGYGANTGIDDAHNLAWKLEAVLKGVSAPALLDTYDAERRPIAWLRHDQIFARPDYARFVPPGTPTAAIIDDDAMELGQLYRSAAVLDAGPELPPALRPDQWAGQPGTRAPHVVVAVEGEAVSTLDLVQPGWVLLTGDAGWRAVAEAVGAALGVPVTCRVVAGDAFHAAFGLAQSGATLLRPDGYIAWRATALPGDPVAALGDALGRVAFAARHA